MDTRMLARSAIALWYGRAMSPSSKLHALGIMLAFGALSACSAALNFDALSSEQRDGGLGEERDAATATPKAGTGASGARAASSSGAGGGASRAESGAGGSNGSSPRAGTGAGGRRASAGSSAAGSSASPALPDDDAGVAPDSTFACAKQGAGAILCDDFEGPPLTQTWSYLITRPAEADAGVLQIDGTDAVSQEHSLLTVTHAGLEPASDLALGVGQDLSTIAGQPSHIELDFDMKLEQFDSRTDHSLVAMQVTFGLYSENWYSQLLLSLQNTATGVKVGFGESDVPIVAGAEMRRDTRHPPQPLAAGEWLHVHFAFDSSDRAEHVRRVMLRVGEHVLYEGELAYLPRKLTPHLELGAPWVDHTGGSQTWRLRYDNVLLRVTPL